MIRDYHTTRLLFGVLLLAAFCGIAVADYGWGDSGPFSLDLSATLYDTSGSGDSDPFLLDLSTTWYDTTGQADSGGFALDTLWVRRSWGDSNTFEIICIEDGECDDMDACTADRCVEGECFNTPTMYGDADHNGAITIFDVFCILDGFAGEFIECTFQDCDIEPCEGDDTIGIFDLFAVLNAFGGDNPCECEAGPR